MIVLVYVLAEGSEQMRTMAVARQESANTRVLNAQKRVRILIPAGRSKHEQCPVTAGVNGRVYLIERGVEVEVPWAGVSDKPADYQPAAHVHTFADLDEKPESFPPTPHGHGWGEVAGKPASYPPVSHSHPASEISDVIPVAKGGTGRTDGKAVALASSRTISLSGDVPGSGSFDGSSNANISVTLKAGTVPSNGMPFYVAAGYPAAPIVVK